MNNNGGIIGWFARNSVATNLLLISVIFMGIMSLTTLRKETFPSIEPSRVTVSVTYEAGNPKQSEEGIAIKIEDALESVDGIKRITSSSTATGSSVVIEKESTYELDTLMSDIKDQIDTINNFPSDAEQPIIEKAKRNDHAIWVQLYGDVDRSVLQPLAEKLKSDLLQKSSINKVEISSYLDPYISIEINEETLQSYGLTLSDVETVINGESTVTNSTSLRNDDKSITLKATDQLYTVEDFAEIPVIFNEKGSYVKLGEIATIKDDFDDSSFSLSRYNSQNGMSIEVTMGDNSDISAISSQAKAVVEEWTQNNYLPSDVSVTTWQDNSEIIKSRLDLLSKNALTGIVLVFIVLALFLNLTVAFWVAAGLPFVFFGTMFFMTDSFLGITINQMTTFVFIMALGIVVDDAVVIGESIYSTRRKYGDTLENTIYGTKRVAIPTIFGVLTTVASFMALSNVEGSLGQIFAQFGTVVTICLLLSMVESKLILPSHLAHLNTKDDKKGVIGKLQSGADNLLTWFNDKIYRKSIKFLLSIRYAVVVLFVALIIAIGSMPLTGKIRVSFFPEIPGDKVNADLSMYNDVGYGQTYENLLRMEQMAYEADKELTNKYSTSYIEDETYIDSLQIIGNSDTSGSSSVFFSDDVTYTAKEFADLWQTKIGNMEGVKKLKVMSMREFVDNFKIELKSTDSESVSNAGAEIKAYLQDIDGVTGIDDNLTEVIPQFRFNLTEQGRAMGFTSSELSSQILNSFGGGTVQKFQKDADEITVSVRYPEENRKTLDDVLEANVRTTSGVVVPLTAVAEVTSTYQQYSLRRIDRQMAINVSAVVDKDVVSSNELVNLVKTNILPQLEIKYPHLNVSFAGEAEEQEEALTSMALMAAGAMLGIFALLAIPLKSYVQPIIIMTSIPFGVIGAILGHYITGLQISILSLFGVLALSGVVVNDSLLLVSRFNDHRDEFKTTVEGIIESCTSRLRAVLLTSITTFAGLIPLLSETSLQAQFLKPAAASLGYGIMFATMITLVLIPVLLLIKDDIENLFRKKETA